MTQVRSLSLVALALAVAVVVVQARAVVGGETWNDVRYHTQVAPPRLAAADAVRTGELPAWWDGSGLGVPLAAEPSHGAMYPPLWLAATPRALDLVMIAHLVWAALGVAVWARRRKPPATIGTSDLGALLAGILVVTTGVLTSTALRGALPAIAHLPWLGAAASALAVAPDRRERARAAAAIGVLIALIGLVGELAILVDAIALVIVLGARRRSLPWVAAGLAGGLAVAAAQWLPAILQLPLGTGAELTGMPFARLIELIVPGSFGSSDPDRAITAVAGATPWAPSLFIGAPLLALAAVRAPSRRLLGLITGVAIAALVVGRGGWPAWLGAPEVHVAVLAILLAPLAGAGLDPLIAGDRRAILSLAVGAGCVAVAIGALGALRTRHPDAAPAIERAMLDAGLGVVCIAAAITLAWRAPGRGVPFLLALLVLPSVGALPSVAPSIRRSVVEDEPLWATAIEEAARPARVFRPAFMSDHTESVDDAIASFAGASAWKWGIAAARSEDPARLPAHDRVWLAAAGEGGALLDRFGIGLAILPSTMLGSHKFTSLGVRGRWALVSLPVAPIAAVQRGWRWSVAPDDAIPLMFAPGGGTNVLRGTVVLRGAGPSHEDARGPLPCAIQHWRAGDLDLVCTPDADGYAVVSSTAAPGWTVAVDGRDADWLTADVLRRAVAITPGMHHVQWRYTTPGARAGLLLAAAGLLGLAALWLASRRVISS